MSVSREPAAVTVLSGATTSTRFRTQATRGSFQIPATFTGTNCAVHGSIDGTNFTVVAVEGNEVQPLVVTANGTYSLPDKALNYKYLRFVVDAQAQDVSIALFARD